MVLEEDADVGAAKLLVRGLGVVALDDLSGESVGKDFAKGLESVVLVMREEPGFIVLIGVDALLDILLEDPMDRTAALAAGVLLDRGDLVAL